MTDGGPPWTLLVGVGNRQRGDDAAGLVVADQVRLGGAPTGAVIAREGDCLTLVDEWAGHEAVIVVDAAAPAGRPGRIHRFRPHEEALPAALARSSTHAFGVPEAVELARTLGRLPRRVEVYAIEGAAFGFGDALTPVVAAAASRLAGALERRQAVTRSRSSRSR